MAEDESPRPAPPKRRPLLTFLIEVALAVPVAAAGLWALAAWRSGDRGSVRLAAGQVGLFVDRLRGEVRVLERPGYHLFLPWLQRVEVLEGGARTVRLGPGTPDSAPIDLRARDGSSFGLDGLEVRVRVVESNLPQLAAELGTGFLAQRQLTVAFTRALLPESFGSLEAQEATDSERLAAGRAATREALEEVLARRGLELVALSTPKPLLERRFERAIDERRLAQAELDQLRADLARAEELRPRRLEVLAAQHAKERIELEGDLGREQLLAEAKATEDIAGAERARRTRENAARRRAETLTAQSEAASAEADAEAARILADAAAVEARGPLAVREALIARLAESKIRLEIAQRPAHRQED